jgi:hypothetical protein
MKYHREFLTIGKQAAIIWWACVVRNEFFLLATAPPIIGPGRGTGATKAGAKIISTASIAAIVGNTFIAANLHRRRPAAARITKYMWFRYAALNSLGVRYASAGARGVEAQAKKAGRFVGSEVRKVVGRGKPSRVRIAIHLKNFLQDNTGLFIV